MLAPPRVRRLHFYADCSRRPCPDEVHLAARWRRPVTQTRRQHSGWTEPPVAHGAPTSRAGNPAPRRPAAPAPVLQSSRDARIEQIELRTGDLLHLGAPPPGWQPEADERVGQDAKYPCTVGRATRGIARDPCEVRHLAVRSAPPPARKRANESEPPHECFLLDLLAQVVRDVGVHRVHGVLRVLRICGRRPSRRTSSMSNVEVELGGCQWKELPIDRPSSQQIHVEAFQLAGARPAQGESVSTPVFRYRSRGPRGAGGAPAGPRPPLPSCRSGAPRPACRKESGRWLRSRNTLGAKQVEPERVRQHSPQPGRLSGSARAQQEERPVRKR